jgi:hypothetical protein
VAGRYTALIRSYCISNGDEIPIGFGRRSASQHSAAELTTLPKLIARTWFNQQDVV